MKRRLINYTVCNLELADINDGFFYEANAEKYFVIWWKGIALGELYTTAENLPAEIFKTKIEEAILPNINNYLADNLNLTTGRILMSGMRDFDRFKQEMSQLFEGLCAQPQETRVSLSVVICTRNRPSDLVRCLQSIFDQKVTPDEVIVVDNAPDNLDTKNVVEKFPQVRYCVEERPGLDVARNSGALIAKHNIVAYVDDDVEVHSLWSLRIFQSFSDPKIGAVTGLVIPASLNTESQQIFEKFWGFNKGFKKKIFDSEYLKTSVPRVWEIGAGANMAFRADVLTAANYFDERLDAGAAGCSGDSEIWFRLLASGTTILYNPLAVVSHYHRANLSELHKQLFSYMRGYSAAALIQHAQRPGLGYRRHILWDIPKYYLILFKAGFPNYKFRYRTVWNEFAGVVSGILFYYRNRTKPAMKSRITP